MTKTVFFLMAMYETPVVSAKAVHRDFFSHLSFAGFLREVRAGQIPLPLLGVGGDAEVPHGVHVTDLAAYIDAERAAAEAQLNGGQTVPPVHDRRAARSNPPYTPDSLAKEWGVSANHVRNLIKSGELGHFKLGRLLRISRSAVDAYELREVAIAGKGPSRA
jgi:excisionase family DNA binding protein